MTGVVFTGELFTIKRYLDGRGRVREVCSRLPTVGVIAVTDDKKIVLVNEKRDKYKDRVYSLPSGRVDKESKPEEGAQRELREETGLRAETLELFMRSEPSNTLEYDRLVYIARGLRSDPLPQDDDEDIQVEHKTLEEAATLALEGKIRPEISALAILRFKFAVETGKIKL